MLTETVIAMQGHNVVIKYSTVIAVQELHRLRGCTSSARISYRSSVAAIVCKDLVFGEKLQYQFKNARFMIRLRSCDSSPCL